jgi:CTP synthase (UTP-ammonia lyase)
MASQIKIGIIGDYDPNNPTHLATNEGIDHATKIFAVYSFEITWLATNRSHPFGDYHGLLCSPGSPYKSLEGALLGIQCAREKHIPLLGTCGGFQHLILEYARNVIGIREAAHAETEPSASCVFITPLSCSLVGKTMEISVDPGSRAAEIYKSNRASEKYYCNFGLNPAYQEQLKEAGLTISGSDQAGEARIIELAAHPFFFGTLFVPQANSSRNNPHPIVVEFLRSAAQRSKLQEFCTKSLEENNLFIGSNQNSIVEHKD